MLNPEQLAKLAANYDPAAVLQQLSTGGATGGVNNETGAFDSSDNPWSGIMNPSAGPAAKGAAPIDPRSMMALNSLMPQPAKPQFIGGAAPRQPVPVNLQIPDISALMQLLQQPQQNKAAPVPTLGSLLGAK